MVLDVEEATIFETIFTNIDCRRQIFRRAFFKKEIFKLASRVLHKISVMTFRFWMLSKISVKFFNELQKNFLQRFSSIVSFDTPFVLGRKKYFLY